MTAEERKEGLRKAVNAKLPLRPEEYSPGTHIMLLWEIIDSLVDECSGALDPTVWRPCGIPGYEQRRNERGGLETRPRQRRSFF